jgi:hypothetical protein
MLSMQAGRVAAPLNTATTTEMYGSGMRAS